MQIIFMIDLCNYIMIDLKHSCKVTVYLINRLDGERLKDNEVA